MTAKTSTSLVIAALVLSVAGTSAFARGQGPDFATLDADSNGEISREEMQNAGAARFASVDADGDGFLTQAELEAQGSERAKKRAARMIERMDANEDGKLSTDELTARRDPGKMFDRIDADDSGTITQAEFDDARSKFRKHRSGQKSKN